MQYYATPIYMLAPEAPPFIPFSNLKERPDLISLEDARQDPAIVYGSFERLSGQMPVSPISSPCFPASCTISPAGSPVTTPRKPPGGSCRPQFTGDFDCGLVEITPNRRDTKHQERRKMSPAGSSRREHDLVRGNWL